MLSSSANEPSSGYVDKMIIFLYKYCASDSNGGSSNTQLTQLIEQMNATINSQQTMIALLQNQISGMNETINNLQTTTSNQQTTIDNHKTTINNYGTSIITHEAEINALQGKDGLYKFVFKLLPPATLIAFVLFSKLCNIKQIIIIKMCMLITKNSFHL